MFPFYSLRQVRFHSIATHNGMGKLISEFKFSILTLNLPKTKNHEYLNIPFHTQPSNLKWLTSRVSCTFVTYVIELLQIAIRICNGRGCGLRVV